MTLNIAIQGVLSNSDLGTHIVLQVKGSKSGILRSPPLTSAKDKWNPFFNIDCSKGDALEFYLYSDEGEQRNDIGFGRLGIQGFIKREGDELDSKKAQKFLLDLMMQDRPTEQLEMWVTYNPYKLFEGQFCQKISLNMKGSYKEEQRSASVNQEHDIMEQRIDKATQKPSGASIKSAVINKTNLKQTQKKFTSELGNRVLKYGSLMKNSQKQDDKNNVEQLYSKRKLPNQGKRMPSKMQEEKTEQKSKKNQEQQVHFYRGQCQTVNFFSCLDQSVKGQQFSFTQSSYKRKR